MTQPLRGELTTFIDESRRGSKWRKRVANLDLLGEDPRNTIQQ